MPERRIRRIIRGLIAVLAILSVAVAVLFWRDRAQTAERRQERTTQVRANCKQIEKLRVAITGIVHLIPGSNPRAAAFIIDADKLLASAQCDPSKIR